MTKLCTISNINCKILISRVNYLLEQLFFKGYKSNSALESALVRRISKLDFLYLINDFLTLK